MIDENDSIKITDLSIVSFNTDDCSDYVLVTGSDGDTGWANYKLHYDFSNTVNFYGNNGAAVQINFQTGDLTIASHMTVDEAAKLFWERVTALNPIRNVPIPQNVSFEYNPPVIEALKTPEERALEAYTRAMKVVG